MRKRWIKDALKRGRVMGLASHFRPPALIVLMYHSVLDDPRECADSIGVNSIHSTAHFRAQMEVVARHFNPVTIDDVRRFVSGGKTLPRRSVAVTFDDGYADNVEIAAPVLNRLGIPGAFYVTVESIDTGSAPWFCRLKHAFVTTRKLSWVDSTGRVFSLNDGGQRDDALLAASDVVTRLVGRAAREAVEAIERDLDTSPLAPKKPLMMTWAQARTLHRQGHVIGSHSLTHPNLAHVGDSDLNREVIESKHKIESELAAPVIHFSYPAAALHQSWTEHTVRATERAGYRTAVTTTQGVVGRQSNALALRRIGPPDGSVDFQRDLEWAGLVLSRS